MSSAGNRIKITPFGESHGKCVGIVIDGLPAGIRPDEAYISEFLARRKGAEGISTERRENDIPEYLSGVRGGVTNGYPLCVVFRNGNARREEYDAIADTPRPGHADFTAKIKYGDAADISGGGHFSGRLTLPVCFAGAIAKQILGEKGVTVEASLHSVLGQTEDTEEIIRGCKNEGDSAGGVVKCVVRGFPAGLGGPVFDGLEGKLAQYVFGIPGVKGIEFGSGFRGSCLKGSENNDSFVVSDGTAATETNNCGGILGGISTGGDIEFRVAFKPTPSIAKEQRTVNMKTNENAVISVKGRHDPCIALRGAVAVEAAAALALLDELI